MGDLARLGGTKQATCWLVDTRSIWPGDKISNASGATEALALLSAEEKATVLSKMFAQDARMSLASALLKRLYLSKTLGIPWHEVRIGRMGDPKHGKPCAVDAHGRQIKGLDFNVSHQAGLVALIGYDGRRSDGEHGDVVVGIDIVCVNERNDWRYIDSEGLEGWVDIYDAVFGDDERWSMKFDVDRVVLTDGTVLTRDELGRNDRCVVRGKQITLTRDNGESVTFSSDAILNAKLRRFYAFFCYKEAYIKLEGEALLAPWLKQLEFHGVRSPLASRTIEPWGEEVDDVEVALRGQPIKDVRMKIRAYNDDFMISTAVKGANVDALEVMGPLDLVDLLNEVALVTAARK